jgi:hypothetical protein
VITSDPDDISPLARAADLDERSAERKIPDVLGEFAERCGGVWIG